MTKDDILKKAGDSFKWSRSKCLSWYKLQNPHLNGNSPKELVERGDIKPILDLLKKRQRD